MQQSLALTTLGGLREGSRINVERAAKDGAEIGGHPLSGHVDFMARVAQVRQPENNHVLRIACRRRGCATCSPRATSPSTAPASRWPRRARSDGSGWFEVWLIPETLRMTTFGDKAVGARLNIEIERSHAGVRRHRARRRRRAAGAAAAALEALLR
jgi:riboflavin synthase